MASSSSPSSSSQYLSSKTSALASTTPVSAAQAQAAQIPLQSFELPTFPPEAFTAGLGALILTSDIKLDEYTDLLSKPFTVPELPPSVKSLTLELFSLGYPPGFLTTLGKQLPGLKTLTVYSQLFGGTTTYSHTDAIDFLKFQPNIQELHLLDIFGTPAFFADMAKALTPNLRLLELNYTYRHSDPHFLSTLPSASVPALVAPSLVALTLSISAPDVTDDTDDREGTEIGIVPIAGLAAMDIAGMIAEQGTGLVMLDVTMFELELGQVGSLLEALAGLRVLSFCVCVAGWERLFESLGERDRGVEVLEIVAVPEEGMVEALKEEAKGFGIKREMLERLGTWTGLRSVKVSISRTRVEVWVREGAGWERKT